MNGFFDNPPALRGTGSAKWDTPREDGVLPLWIADMDFRAAPPVLDALHRRIDLGVFGYASEPPRWRDALVGWLSRRHGWSPDPETAIPATGVLPALGAVVRALCGERRRVAMLVPAYNCFFSTVRGQGAEPLPVPLRRTPPAPGAKGDFSFEIDFDALDAALGGGDVGLFLLCNPHNPCGRAWTKEELTRLAETCRRRGVPVASDEIHADLQMPGSSHVPFASVAPDAAAVLFSASKSFNLAGLQTAAALVPDKKLRARIADDLVSRDVGEPGPLGFAASRAAWLEGDAWLDALREHLAGNYRTLLDFAKARLPLVRVATLEATYLAWIDATATGAKSSLQLARRLEREAGVRVSPGSIYGEEPGTVHLRLNLATSRERLEEALRRAEKVLGSPAPADA